LEVKYLKFNGNNFTAWERQINTTLDFVFNTDGFLSTNGWTLLNQDHKPSTIILLRSSIDKSLTTAVSRGKTPYGFLQVALRQMSTLGLTTQTQSRITPL
jgi:hypothetical protein